MKRLRRVLYILSLFLVLNMVVDPKISFAADTYEVNDWPSVATSLSFSRLTTSAISYISSSSDTDWYKVNVDHAGLYSFTLTNNHSDSSVAYGNLPGDYDVEVYNSNLTLIASSKLGSYSWEKAYFNTSAGDYYFKIIGYNGSYNSTVPYKLVIQHGDAVMFAEAAKFRDYDGRAFYDRLVDPSTGINNYWHSKGVAYGFGSKDSFSHNVSDIVSANDNALTPFDRWNKYNYPTYPRPGRVAGDNVTTTKYTGIDCSGFIQRCAQAAGSRYQIARDTPLNSTDGLAGNQVAAASMGTWSTAVTASNLQTGDIAYWTTHTVMFAKINPNVLEDCKIIEAAGDELEYGGRVVKESSFSKYLDRKYTLARLKQ